MGGQKVRISGCTLSRVETPKRGRGRPPTGETPKRYFRAGQIWDDAVAIAHERGETVTALAIRALEREVARLRREKKANE